MKGKTLPYFLSLHFFPSPLRNKQTFVVQTMVFQTKRLRHYVSQSHKAWF